MRICIIAASAVRCLDVGGGLGVHYGGGYGVDDSAINYSLQEYANAVVFSVQEICASRDVPEPVLISESGRAITAHHSVLVVPVLGAHGHAGEISEPLPERRDGLVQRMLAALEEARNADDNVGELLEAYHDAQEARAEADTVFRLGFLELEQLATLESLYWGACREILDGLVAANLETPPPVQAELEALLTDMYLCDFSVFHSMLDHWAIHQLFPIMPLQRLNERPDRRAVVVDLTCDSDGKVSEYVSSLEDRSHLPLHVLKKGEPYYLGIFLVGAYQDILGDAHNLFGRLPEVHVYADDEEDRQLLDRKSHPRHVGARDAGAGAVFPQRPEPADERTRASTRSKPTKCARTSACGSSTSIRSASTRRRTAQPTSGLHGGRGERR